MSLRNALALELRSVSPLRQASVAPMTFRDYSENVRNLLTYVSALQLPTNTPADLDKAVSSYGIYLYDLKPKRGSLQKYRCTIYGIIFFLPELKALLGRSKQTEKGWDKTVP